MLVFLIGVAFAPIAPVVVPFCALYFIVAYIVWKHNVIYTYRQRYRSSGITWPIIFRLVVTCSIVSHFTTFGLFAFREVGTEDIEKKKRAPIKQQGSRL